MKGFEKWVTMWGEKALRLAKTLFTYFSAGLGLVNITLGCVSGNVAAIIASSFLELLLALIVVLKVLTDKDEKGGDII